MDLGKIERSSFGKFLKSFAFKPDEIAPKVQYAMKIAEQSGREAFIGHADQTFRSPKAELAIRFYEKDNAERRLRIWHRRNMYRSAKIVVILSDKYN